MTRHHSHSRHRIHHSRPAAPAPHHPAPLPHSPLGCICLPVSQCQRRFHPWLGAAVPIRSGVQRVSVFSAVVTLRCALVDPIPARVGFAVSRLAESEGALALAIQDWWLAELECIWALKSARPCADSRCFCGRRGDDDQCCCVNCVVVGVSGTLPMLFFAGTLSSISRHRAASTAEPAWRCSSSEYGAMKLSVSW